jgi:hypothetical protein
MYPGIACSIIVMLLTLKINDDQSWSGMWSVSLLPTASEIAAITEPLSMTGGTSKLMMVEEKEEEDGTEANK